MKHIFSLCFVLSVVTLFTSISYSAELCESYGDCGCCEQLLEGNSGNSVSTIMSNMEQIISMSGQSGTYMQEIYNQYGYNLASNWESYGDKLTAQEVCDYTTKSIYCPNRCRSGTCGMGDWLGVSDGYEYRYSQEWICNACFPLYYGGIIEYQCAAGYYGTPTSTSSGCYPCLSPGTSRSGSKEQTDCFIPSGNTGEDAKGQFRYKNDCYYVKE